MLSNPLIAFANTYNFDFSQSGDCAYGTVKDYLVSVSSDGYKKIAFINFFTPETDEGDSMMKFKLSEAIDELAALNNLLGLKDYEVFVNGILLRTGAELKDFDESIGSICDLLKEMGFEPMPSCSECGYKVEDSDAYYSIVDNRAMFTCDECTDCIKEENVNKNVNDKVGKKGVGLFGAITGALLSFVIFVVLYLFVMPFAGIKIGKEETDTINSLIFSIPLSVMLSVFTFLFYRLFSGIKDGKRIIPCFAVSAIFTAVSVYSSSAILYTNSFKLSFSSALKMFSTIFCAPVTDPYYRNSLITYGLYSMAAVIAVTLVYSLIFDTKKSPAPEFIPFLSENSAIEYNCNEECTEAECGCGDAAEDTDTNE